MSDSSTADASQTCPLSWPQQRWNLILFALCTGLQYLAAPVLYVGNTQASLCTALGADTRESNLPATLYFAMAAVPALIAWLSPRVSALKRNLVLSYAATALMLAIVAISLSSSASPRFKLWIVVLQGAVSGAVMPAAIAFLWEIVSRGSDESRRGLALGLAFGAGPILAVLGSLGQTALLGGDLLFLHFDGLKFPNSFIILFWAGVPIMVLAAFFAQFFVIAPVELEPQREPVSSVIGLLIGLPLMFASVGLVYVSSHSPESAKPAAEAKQSSSPSAIQSSAVSESLSLSGVPKSVLLIGGYLAGIGAGLAFIYHFRSLLQQRILLLATIVTILVYAGNVIPSNMNLYAKEALGVDPDKYAGVQNVLRFSFKMVTGMALGWMLTRTSPRAGVLATSGIFLLGQIWALFVTGPWYIVAAGIHGAGELIGVYAPNYIVCASRRDQLRRNTAFMTMLMVPAAPAGYLYGAIVDSVKQSGWTAMEMNSATLGFRLSFLVCAAFILSGIVLAALLLPAKPSPEPADTSST